jgi:hypothetical protein
MSILQTQRTQKKKKFGIPLFANDRMPVTEKLQEYARA